MSIPFEKSFASHAKSSFWSSKNEKKPEDVFKSSNKKYWFDCGDCNHNFYSALDKISTGGWCSYCSNTLLCDSIDCEICFNKSFASHEKSVFWSKKNDCKPRDIFKSSHKKYLFDCIVCKHQFDTALTVLSSQNCWCPYCAIPSKKLCDSSDCQLCFNKSFASHEKSVYWSSKNVVKPRDIFISSNIKCWFDCSLCNHEFEQPLNSISSGKWCSYCSNKRLCDSNDCETCFNKSFASYEKSVFWSSKNDCQPRDVFKSIATKYIFDCNKCKHEFEQSLREISSGCGCPYCAVPSKKLCDSSDCQLCFNKSFASHEKSVFWSSKNECQPRNVFKTVATKYIFDCIQCKHVFEQSLRETLSGCWCPYCAIPSKILCDSIGCQLCFNKSFASHEKSVFWSSKNECQPRYVFKSSDNKYLFDCVECNHEFEKSLSSVSAGRWCPYCSNQRLCNSIGCQLCFNKSFASIEKAKFWSNKNECQPRDVFKSSAKKYWFDCNKCKNEFSIALCGVTRGRWCSFCINKTETKLYEIMKQIYPLLITQFKQDWCMKKSYLPYDFCIPEYKIIIELDGPQHFQQVANWSSPEEQFENDKYKEECANQNGYSVIRLLQEDVFYDTYDWVKELCEAIEEIKSSEGITNVYLCKNDEYDQF